MKNFRESIRKIGRQANETEGGSEGDRQEDAGRTGDAAREGGGQELAREPVSLVTDKEGDFGCLADGNHLVGARPKLVGSSVNFKGRDNILYCGEGVRLVNSTLTFHGDRSVIYLSPSRKDYRLNVSIYHDSVCCLGRDNYMNGTLNIVLSERRHVLIGSDCVISFGIWIRNADPHLVYSTETMERVNPTRSIFIGNHVWLGQSAMILKGTKIQAGSILGAMAVAAGREIPANTTWGGNPARQIRDNVFWDGSSVHAWKEEDTEKGRTYGSDRYIYAGKPEGRVDFDAIDWNLNDLHTPRERLDYLRQFEAGASER